MIRVMTCMSVAALAVALLSGCEKPPAPAPTVRPVQLAKVALGIAPDMAVYAGTVTPRHEIDLAFRIAGKIVERRAEVGSAVKRGEVLARLDPSDVALQARAAEAALAAARTEATLAQAELARFENLHRQKFVSDSALDQRRAAAQASAARLRQAEASLEVQRNHAAYATLVAPENGVITAVSAERGQVVGAGQALMKLARTDEREVLIAVPEGRIAELRSARRIDVLAASEQRFEGRVREIAPSADPVTRTFGVRVALPSAGNALRWGTTVNVVLLAEGASPGALIPMSSIYHAGDGRPAVWIYDPATQTVDLRIVELGPYREDGVIVQGLDDGEWVVAAGVHKLQPGQKVRPYEQPGKSPAPVAGG